MEVKNISIQKIHKAKYNPRIIYDKEFQDLISSIKEFGFVEPIVVNTREHADFEKHQWTIVGGHQRYEAAKKIGHKEVPVIFVNLSPQKEKILNLALNKITGEFDNTMLAEIMYGLVEEDKLTPDDILGFSHEEISKLLDTVMDIGDEDDDFDLEKEKGLAKNTKIKNGDIYEIGKHRLMCGNSTIMKSVRILMNGEKANMIFTDPPFNVGLEYQEYQDNKTDDEYMSFCKKFMKNIHNIMSDKSSIYLMIADKYTIRVGTLFEDLFRFSQILFWVKENPTLGNSDYQYNYEAILYGWRKGGKHKFYGGNAEPAANFVKRDRGKDKVEHPAQRPIELVNDYIKNSSQRDELVVDLFGGSGTTMVSANSCNRRCYMMEMDPIYVQIIINRMKKIGVDAKLI